MIDLDFKGKKAVVTGASKGIGAAVVKMLADQGADVSFCARNQKGVEELTAISGQKAVITYAKKAISNFKTRAGDPVGVCVTLRTNMMYEFLDRFISVASPRIRDFQGLPNKGFDGRGNYNFGTSSSSFGSNFLQSGKILKTLLDSAIFLLYIFFFSLSDRLRPSRYFVIVKKNLT